MTAATQHSEILRRKIAPPREPDALRQCREGWARSVDDRLGVAMDVSEVTRDRIDRDALLKGFPDAPLIFVLTEGADTVGLAALDPQAVGAIVEAQTLGQVISREVRSRRATALDAALVQPLVSTWLAEATGLLGGRALAVGGRLEDARAAKLAMDDGMLARLIARLDFGALEGVIHLAVAPRRDVAREQPDLREVLGRVDVSFDVVLARVAQPYSFIEELEVDQTLEIPREAFERVELCAAKGGEGICQGRLGRMGLRRAVRVVGADAPDAAVPSATEEVEEG